MSKIENMPLEARLELLERAKKMAETKGLHCCEFVQHVKVKKRLVRVKVPPDTDRLLGLVPESNVFAIGDTLKSIVCFGVPEHYTRDEKIVEYEPGKKRPVVIRNFYVLPEDLGKEILATVKVSRRYNIVTGHDTIIIDIVGDKKSYSLDQLWDCGYGSEECQDCADTRNISSAEFILKIGAQQKRVPGEVAIPLMPETCVRFDEIERKVITKQIAA